MIVVALGTMTVQPVRFHLKRSDGSNLHSRTHDEKRAAMKGATERQRGKERTFDKPILISRGEICRQSMAEAG